MKWRSSTSNFNRCSKRFSWFKPEKMYCMENVLPDTKIMALRKKKPSGIHLDDYLEKKIAPPLGNTAYREGCGGDSGSGQFISNDVEYKPGNMDRLKLVQVAIFSNGGDTSFEHGGESYYLPCGTYSYNMKESKRLNEEKNSGLPLPWQIRDYYHTVSISHKTTGSEALRWIKIKAGICKDVESCTIS